MAEAVRKLKGRKAAGPDGLLAEKFATGEIIIWLKNIMNSIFEFEVIPDVLKSGVLVH